MTSIPRTLGRWDLILLKIVAIVNINNVPAVAVYGWTSLVLWTVAFATFFVPEAIAVVTLSRRYPGEGGIYLWIRKEFGEAHGFLSGWCYWTNNLFYVPVLLVYMAGIFAFAGGEARAAALVNQKVFVGAMAFGWLAFITLANVRGLVPVEGLGVIQGVMQAVAAGAHAAGIAWIVAPLAIVMGLAAGGAASAWFAGSSRVPFVAGLTSALPPALGRVHPHWRSPHVALITCAILTAMFTALSFVGSSVAEAYQVLLKAAVVIQLVPFIYLFLALARMRDVGPLGRAAGWVGLGTTAVSLAAAFLPTADVTSVLVFESKLIVGVVGPTALGWFLFRRSAR